MWHFARSYEEDVLDSDNIYSNDIHAGLITYGVEMARAAILKEIKGVFGAYNIEIDGRHLELIADYMVSRCLPVSSALLTKQNRPSTEATSRSTEKASRQAHHRCSKRLTRRQPLS